MKESNRWVKKAQTIPWPEIEKRYAALFTNRKGNVAKPFRFALGACIIQAEYGYSDEETAAHVIAMSVLVLNPRKICRALLRTLTAILEILIPQRHLVFGICSVDIISDLLPSILLQFVVSFYIDFIASYTNS